ncbi:MAG: DUF1016 N-terminal domain-containing protein [Saccharofermentanales bacterium]|jgi:predicted nuclease of restriction endonuclease-like (RecB) superfamily
MSSNELTKYDGAELVIEYESIYCEVKEILTTARNKVYRAASFAMVEAYWNIGKAIVEKQGGKETAEYDSRLFENLSEKMTRDFGKGFTTTNLKYMRQFYLTFPNRHTLCDDLSWSHYRLLMRVEDEKARAYYYRRNSKI